MCVIYFFFFFKQKTAYEMRISDWSSDVCSSDLQTLRLAAGIDQRTPHGGVVPDQRTILLERRDRNNFAAQAHVRDTDCAPLAEIGRASCRERVCQYV